MNLEDYRTVFISVCLILVLGASSPVIGMFLPVKEEPFFAMGLLGEKGMAEGYYPNGDPDIGVGVPVLWYVYLYNHMGSTQYVAVRLKLLNSSQPSPDSSLCSPSPVPYFFEVLRVLVKNETWIFPFSWRIAEASYSGDWVRISRLTVNDVTFGLDSYALHGYNFRLVFEFWVYNKDSGDFRFFWRSGDKGRCVWLQIWFNATLVE